ncbi:hypothetical protein F5877DRAFT_64725 [Lentinula edodes]|nr:hypothetical protein F5877DRAFT_64725 [Lentinula edodes]
MTRRSNHKLQKLHVQRLMRPISASDGFGWIYAYVDWGSEWKIGMTNDFVRRRKDWDQQCPCLNRMWLPPIPVANRRRAEIHLRWSSYARLEKDCGAGAAEGSSFLKRMHGAAAIPTKQTERESLELAGGTGKEYWTEPSTMDGRLNWGDDSREEKDFSLYRDYNYHEMQRVLETKGFTCPFSLFELNHDTSRFNSIDSHGNSTLLSVEMSRHHSGDVSAERNFFYFWSVMKRLRNQGNLRKITLKIDKFLVRPVLIWTGFKRSSAQV